MDRVRFPHVLFLPASKASEEIWQPRADVYRISDGWLVKVELAGVRPEQVEVSVHGNALHVQGTRRDERLHECLNCYRLEIAYSQFERVLELPGLSEAAIIEASYQDGMLLVRIKTEAQP